MSEPRILIVEDNPLNMKLAKTVLEINHYRVFQAEDAPRGIELAQQVKPDLILMDIQLPGMDGLTATKHLKADPALGRVPVIAMTAAAMREDEKLIMEAGCDGWITKPIDTRGFIKKIEQYLKGTGREQYEQARSAVHRARILIVDDEPLNVKLLAAKLSQEPYDLLKASSGTEALERVAAESPDLILMDIMMPDLDGVEVTRRIKEDPAFRDIPIIIITALDSTEDKVRVLEAGAEEFLNKPVNTTELVARINSMLRLRQYKEQLALRVDSRESFDAPADVREQAREPLQQPLILVVEDNERDSVLLKGYLHGQPYRMLFAANSAEAMDLIGREQPDLILLDLILPDMDGFELTRRLKDADATKDIQVIVTTGLQDLENKIKSIEVGADDYLIKPINSRELLARIAILLEKKAYLDRLRSQYESALASVVIDGLTGLYNRLYLKRFLDLETKRSLRHRYPVGLLLIALDNVPGLTRPGEQAVGEAVLREAARLIRGSLRETDLAARYDAGMFAAVLPYGERKGVLRVAQRILEALTARPFAPQGALSPIPAGAGIGLAFCPADAKSAEDLLSVAEEALHRAMHGGAGRIETAG